MLSACLEPLFCPQTCTDHITHACHGLQDGTTAISSVFLCGLQHQADICQECQLRQQLLQNCRRLTGAAATATPASAALTGLMELPARSLEQMLAEGTGSRQARTAPLVPSCPPRRLLHSRQAGCCLELSCWSTQACDEEAIVLP